MGTSAAKAFGDVLLVNKTIQHLNVSDNSFGKEKTQQPSVYPRTVFFTLLWSVCRRRAHAPAPA